MPGTDLRSIPLPSQSIQERPSQKMSAKEILEKALREHKSTKKETSQDMHHVQAPVPDPPAKVESSQHIVDELFKDFISKKMTKTVKTSSDQIDLGATGKGSTSISEMSKLLDMEISSIQAQTKDVTGTGQNKAETCANEKHKPAASKPKLGTESPYLQNLNDLNASSSFSLKQSSSSSNADPCLDGKVSQHPEPCQQNKPKKGESEMMPRDEASSEPALGQSALLQNKVVSNSNSLAKKTSGPKQLGCKLSLESLTLIRSKDKVDRNGRVWEEGEVQSSHSEGSDKDEEASDTDGENLSETGSIASNDANSKHHSSNSKHKKKHKHKHKKKKKKSSKEKDKSKHKSSDNDRKKESSRDKGRRKSSENKSSSNATGSRSKSSEDDGKEEKKADKVCDDNVKTPSAKEKTRSDVKSLNKDKDDGKRAEKSKKRKRDRSRSPKHGRKSKSKSRSRSRSPKKHKRDSSPHRSSTQGQFSEWDARHYSDNPSKTARGSSHSPESKGKSSSRKRSRSRDDDKDLRLKIDKAKLRKIAIANALNNLKSGQGPQLDVVTVKAGGKSVEELTDFCKRISEKDRDNDVSDSSDEEPTTKSNEEDDDELPIHHPFKVKDTSNIVMNIRNAKQLPILTPSEKQAQQAALRQAFPVSSGSHHRASESEWVPVEKTKTVTSTSTTKPVKSQASVDNQRTEESKGVFNMPKETQNIDIGSIISERLSAVRKLQENPYDVQALSTIHKAQEKASQWAASKHLPGQFVGTTGAKVLSQAELIGDRHSQAWAKKSQFTSAAPISSGIGMYLLQKMGWKQGEGLGKHNEGNKEPLQLDIKVDRKGLTTPMENPKAKAQIINVPRAKDLSNKHPVSALMELCNRRRWGAPIFTIVLEDGPDHKKNFLFKVKVNNVEYQPTVPSSNKKSAKALCAAICLQEMGLIPRDAPMNY